MRIRVGKLWLLAVWIVAAMAARLYQIQSQSIWFDEGWSAYAAVQPTLQAAIEADPTNPPLYYVLLNLSTRAFGDSPFALRWFSTLLGLLVIPLTYELAWRLFDKRAGLYAGFLAAFSPVLWWASQEARMYTLMAVLALIAALGWHQLSRKPARWAWFAVWGGELGLLYTHNTGPVAVLWLNLVTLLIWIVRRSAKCPDWRIWIAGQVGIGLLWSPWLITRFVLLQTANSAVSTPPELGLSLLSQLWQALWTGPWLMVEREPIVANLSAILFALALVVIPWQRAAARWLALHGVILTAGLLVGLWAIGNPMHGRYLVMVAPLVLVALGVGLSRLRYVYLRLPAAGLVVLVFVISLHLATQNPGYGHDDARGMAQYYADNLTADDTVLAWSYADRYELAYYWERLGVQAQRVNLPEGSDLETILPLLPSGGDVALNVWYTQRADYRGMMECVLSHGTVNLPEEFIVNGMRDLLYRSPTLRLPEWRALQATFADDGWPVAELVAVGDFPQFAADQALCLPIQIRLARDIPVDLKAAVIVTNDLGWEIARADAIFAQADQRFSSKLELGDLLTAYPLLRLPFGAPAGDYSVRMRIYDEADETSGYDARADGGTDVGKDLPLGTWTVAGADWTRVNRNTDLPFEANLRVNDHATLLAHNIGQPATVNNGSLLRLAFLWEGEAQDMALVGDGWQVDVPARNRGEPGAIVLDWREAQAPADVGAGTAELRLPDGIVIARYTLEVIPAQYTEPEFDAPMGVDFPGVGMLVGYALDGDTFERTQPVAITLVWRAGETTSTSFTVFVQLLNADGSVIAQSDSLPAQGNRPTVGWRVGEYIVDQHQVVFHDDAQPGVATLIAGLYDAVTGQRIVLASGEDAVILAQGLTIQ